MTYAEALAAAREAKERADNACGDSYPDAAQQCHWTLDDLIAAIDAQQAPPAAVVPEPAFRLTWRDGQYRVSKPNIGDTDCYTAEQVRTLLQAPPAAVEAAARAMAVASGWSGWDSAASCADTLSGNEPEEEREYFRTMARVALAAAQGVK